MQKNQLDQLKKYTKIVADTGDIDSIDQYSPQDATTNPSLILKEVFKPKYNFLFEKALLFNKKNTFSNKKNLILTIEKLFVSFGLEILKKVNRVSIEVDARLSFDTKKMVDAARRIIKLFENEKIEKKRVLIKLAATWEGILAAKILEKENIHCNMTLIFSISQAIASADANATLISPFVGRVLDWYIEKKKKFKQDPGVFLVKSIYNYFKKFDIKTEIMGASFRNKDQILSLSGCDLLTISPSLLSELKTSYDKINQNLSIENSKKEKIEKIDIDKIKFYFLLDKNIMAKEKLFNGIEKFSQDAKKLETIILKNIEKLKTL